jgi:hypothetical protein
MFKIKIVEKIKTHILCSMIFSPKIALFWDNVEKYCRAGQATDENTRVYPKVPGQIGRAHV